MTFEQLKNNTTVDYRDDLQLKYSISHNEVLGVSLRNAIYQDDDIVTIDNIISGLIVALNKMNGVKTLYSCGGHENDPTPYVLVAVDDIGNFITTVLGYVKDFHNDIQYIPNIHNSVRVECTVPDKSTDREGIDVVIRFDGNVLTRKLRFHLFEYIGNRFLSTYSGASE